MDKLNFESYGLSGEILRALNLLGFNKPTNVQHKVIPYAIEKKDLIVKSQTGSGKTAAFGIPICENIDIEVKEPQALVLTPTRELCVQVKEDLSNIGRFKRIRCAAIFGKQPVEVQVRELKQRVHIVVGTPGRTMDLINRVHLNVQGIKFLIIDEADKMLNMGFIEQVEDIIKVLPKNRVTMLFSATMSEEIEKLCSKYMVNSVNIEIDPERITAEKVMQEAYEVDSDKKFSLLNKLLYVENPDSCIIFCNTKESVDNLFNNMSQRGYSCSSLHGGMLQNDRLEIMRNFKRWLFRFLIATDVAARGIDVESLTHIINYEVPFERESYVHRIGRTGRAGHKGKAITFVSSEEKKYFNDIKDYIGYDIPMGNVPSSEEVNKSKMLFEEKNKSKPERKEDKGSKINKEIAKIYIGAGKKKKIRPGDIVGAITNIEGITSDNIGVIDIQDNFSYVDILDGKGNIVLERLKNTTIKGKIVKVERAFK